MAKSLSLTSLLCPEQSGHLLTHNLPAVAEQHTAPIKPLYPWAGGKTKLLKEYAPYLPGLNTFNSFVEPFFGGGAFFTKAVNDSSINEFVMNDINQDIVGIYRTIQQYPERVIAKCESYAKFWNHLQHEEDKKSYYNSLKAIYATLDADEIEAASILIIMLKVCYGAIWKTNKKSGKFNGSYGGKGKKLNIDAELIRNWSRQLQNTSINSLHYRDVPIPETPSLIFCDPPYRGTKIDYASPFKDQDHIELIHWCIKQSQLGHTVVLTNQEIGDKFFEQHLPAGVAIHYLDYQYMTGSKKNQKGKKAKDAIEILMVFHPVEKPKDLDKVGVGQGEGESAISDLNNQPNTIAIFSEYRDGLKHHKHQHQAFQYMEFKHQIITAPSGGMAGVKAGAKIGALVCNVKLHRFAGKWQCAP